MVLLGKVGICLINPTLDVGLEKPSTHSTASDRIDDRYVGGKLVVNEQIYRFGHGVVDSL